MKVKKSTFEIASKGFMFADTAGVARATYRISEGVDKIEFQFKDGQSFGYRDSNSKITYFKTVYSNDMLRGDRLDFREKWEEIKKPIFGLIELLIA
ncbi:hypothetical protein BH09BAC3_BH09BAC3_36090 [soil metagenome]